MRGKKVLDFAAGAGLVAIAASKSGARSVEANEIDNFALAAIALNAKDNGAEVSLRSGDLIGQDEGWDIVLAGDIAYERDMTARVFAWLHQLAKRGTTVLIGDPGGPFYPKRVCKNWPNIAFPQRARLKTPRSNGRRFLSFCPADFHRRPW